MSLAVICPTRDRPESARQAYLSFQATKTLIETVMVFVVDADDPKLLDYKNSFEFNGDTYHLPVISPEHAGGMGNALNAAAERMARSFDIVGFIGDDHRFRTLGWDQRIGSVLANEGGGIAYGDDLAQRINLPTQVFISSEILKALGWMALPGAKHLYLDNAWKDLGEALDRLYYFPDIVIEHLHPAYGKADWDDNYRRVNDGSVYAHDAEVFAQWKATGFAHDVERVRAVLEHLGRPGGVERGPSPQAPAQTP